MKLLIVLTEMTEKFSDKNMSPRCPSFLVPIPIVLGESDKPKFTLEILGPGGVEE